MKDTQTNAIATLEAAMQEIADAGLALAGVDDGLIVFDKAVFLKISAGRGPAECINEFDSWTLDAPYIDSGAT